MKKLLASLSLGLLLSACGPHSFGEAVPEWAPLLSQETLQNSLSLGREFMLSHQTERGDFDYEYDYAKQSTSLEVNQVRQAGALWGLTLMQGYQPSQKLSEAIQKSLAFFKENSKPAPQGRYITYPDESQGDTGMLALITLSLVDFLESDSPEVPVPNKEAYEQDLRNYSTFLLSLRQENGLFYKNYKVENGESKGANSPYYDGESLLALVRTAKYFEEEEWGELLQESAEKMYETYVLDALKEDPDSDQTKGFYQWGSMAFYELYTSPWKKEVYAEWTLHLANWMVDVHDVLGRSQNTGYAFEGLIAAYELARLTGNSDMQNKLAQVIDTGLIKLTRWQITAEDSSDPLALGGAPNTGSGTTLRIDTIQHQMHAVLMALEFIYTP